MQKERGMDGIERLRLLKKIQKIFFLLKKPKKVIGI